VAADWSMLVPVVLLWGFYLAAIVDWWRTDPVDVQTMAKPAWVLAFLFFWVAGAAAWFVWGHPWKHRHRA